MAQAAAVSQSGTITTVAGGISGAGLAVNMGIGATDVAATPDGEVIVADSQQEVVWDVTPSGFASVIAGNGAAGYSGDGGPATSAELYSPEGLVVDGAGNVLIADGDNYRIRMVAAATCASSCAYGLSATVKGDIYTIAGDGTAGYSGDGGPATSAELYSPERLVVDGAGNVLIADSGNGRIRLVAAATCASSCAYGLASMTTGDIYLIAGNGTGGFAGDGGPATSAELFGPTGVAVDGAGNLLIADKDNNRIRMVAAATCVSLCAYSLPATTRGDIYTIAGDGTAGFSGDGGPATSAWLAYPRDVDIDGTGNVLIAEGDIDRIRMVAAATCVSLCAYNLPATTRGDIYTIVGDGTAGFSGDGGPATSAELFGPTGVAVDGAGNLLIADFLNSRIRMVAATTCASTCPYGLPYTTKGDIYTIAGDGSFGNSGDGGPATSAELLLPVGETVDHAGNLLVGDRGDVRMVAAATCASACPYGLSSTTKGDIYTIAGNGNFGSSGDGGPATLAQVEGPSGMAVDDGGNLLITDGGTIRMVAAATCASACPYELVSTTRGDIYISTGRGYFASSENGPEIGHGSSRGRARARTKCRDMVQTGRYPRYLEALKAISAG